MNPKFRLVLAICLTCMLPLSSYAVAPVVDESENFVQDDDLRADYHQPARTFDSTERDTSEDIPLAQDREETQAPQNNAALLDKVNGLQQEIQELRGQLEMQAHELQLLKEQQLAFYKDLDTRLRDAPPKSAANTPLTDLDAVPKPSSAVTTDESKAMIESNIDHENPVNEQISYLAAYELVKNKQYEQAQIAMNTFVTQYPQGGYSANAHYWLGEISLTQKNYTEAIAQFETVLHQFPSSSKSAVSLLKLAYALADSGQQQKAIEHLKQVVKNYPDTQTAHLATNKLQSLHV